MQIGRFELSQRLGAGAYGVVWRARDSVLARDVAIKVLHAAIGGHDPQAQHRFAREARALGRVRHPNIVTVHDVVEHEGSIALVLDYCEQGSLADHLREHGQLSADDVRALLRDVASALDAIHSSGIVHRDLKPENILRSQDRWLVGDFGIASVVGDEALTATGLLIGTPEYWAPETLTADSVSSAADIYSLGCVAYAALVGKPPYQHANRLRTGQMHVTDPFPDLPPAISNTAPDLARLIADLTKKPPERRPSATNVVERVSVKATPVGPQTTTVHLGTARKTPPSGAERRTYTQGPLLLGAMLIAFIASGVYAYSSYSHHGEPRKSTASPAQASTSQSGTSPTAGTTAATLVQVPLKLVGAKSATAATTLREAGLFPEIVFEPSSRIRADQVIRTRPNAGAMVDASSTVTLTVSNGPPPSTVPDLVGLPIATATVRAKQAHLTVHIFSRGSTKKPSIVLAQKPEAGSSVARGSEVRVSVARALVWKTLWTQTSGAAGQSPLLKLPDRWRIKFSAGLDGNGLNPFILVGIVGDDGLQSESFQISSAADGEFEPTVGAGRWAVSAQPIHASTWTMTVEALQ